MNERFVYNDENLKPDDCHLLDCDQPQRKCSTIIVIVKYEGVEVAMHPACAMRFKRNVHLENIQTLCQLNAAWN